MPLSDEVKQRRARFAAAREAAIAAGWDPNKPPEYTEETESPNPGPRKKAEPSDTDDLIGEVVALIRAGGYTANGGNLTKEQVIQAALVVALEHPAARGAAAVPPAKPRGRAAAK